MNDVLNVVGKGRGFAVDLPRVLDELVEAVCLFKLLRDDLRVHVHRFGKLLFKLLGVAYGLLRVNITCVLEFVRQVVIFLGDVGVDGFDQRLTGVMRHCYPLASWASS